MCLLPAPPPHIARCRHGVPPCAQAMPTHCRDVCLANGSACRPSISQRISRAAGTQGATAIRRRSSRAPLAGGGSGAHHDCTHTMQNVSHADPFLSALAFIPKLFHYLSRCLRHASEGDTGCNSVAAAHAWHLCLLRKDCLVAARFWARFCRELLCPWARRQRSPAVLPLDPQPSARRSLRLGGAAALQAGCAIGGFGAVRPRPAAATATAAAAALTEPRCLCAARRTYRPNKVVMTTTLSMVRNAGSVPTPPGGPEAQRVMR